MTRIDQRFSELAAQGRKALVPFITCGDPSLEATVPVMHALVGAGADVIELGVPFSDPQADGPVIQRSSERALTRKVGLRQVLECCRRFRDADAKTPVVLMGYLNPMEIFGLEAFAKAAREAGVDGVLVVDCPPEEAESLKQTLSEAGVQLILLASPTTTDERLALIGELSEGYLYYVSFAGVTGASSLDTNEVSGRVDAVRAHCRTPIAVGFGVKDGDSARRAAERADGVVIGSALVAHLAEAGDPESAADAARDFLAPIRAALDGANG
ncbi:tryptophan synthase subunit alpha [Pseudomarimonas salicorniae]|uniref:Tryptophan synthase alpha chain n=1 Tax=Pseudomarimonas salicorniae TaxID=2933270 RepID=A0ABT0GJY2_9GAMM|nr:tryptophan synthase subunit alpha [Lysobacter sp. CAU 1642]MCK7594677.1 tryptophan synthase subunit alpha [Lysobacter sp. CAU 1642]